MKYHWSDAVNVSGMQVPGFRTSLAMQNGQQDNILIRTWGGLGDQICAEPTLRYCLKTFKSVRFSLASEAPYLFEHLGFEKVFHLPKEQPNYPDEYLLWDTIAPPVEGNLFWQFMSHAATNCVDYAAICAIRGQLPVVDRSLELFPNIPLTRGRELIGMVPKHPIFVHPGKHWPSKTFPKDWWDAVLAAIISYKHTPVLIGKDSDQSTIAEDPDAKNRGTVDVETKGCIDLRNRLSAGDSIFLLQDVGSVLLTNDSSPLHMAASGRSWIGFVASCKHPDFITHWRRPCWGAKEVEWGWRMKNFGRGGMWDILNNCPNQIAEITYDQVDEAVLRSWLPKPEDFASWAVNRAEGIG